MVKIHIEDFAELINATLDFKYEHYQDKRIYVSLKSKSTYTTANIIDNRVLIGEYGNSHGLKPTAAVKDYCNKIAGKEITFDDGITKIGVPKGIYYTERKTEKT